MHHPDRIHTIQTGYAPSQWKLHHPGEIRTTFRIEARMNSEQYMGISVSVIFRSSWDQVYEKVCMLAMAIARAMASPKAML